jgi:ATP-binding cassette subfamily B protein
MPEHAGDEQEFSSRLNGRLIIRMMREARPYWRRVLAFVATISVVEAGNSAFTYLNKRIIDDAITAHDSSKLLPICVVFAAILLMQAVGVFTIFYISRSLGAQLQYDLRGKMFRHLQRLPLSYYDRTPVGWIMARVTSDSGRISYLVTQSLIDFFGAVANMTSAAIFMFLINVRLAFLVLLCIPVIIFVALRFKAGIVGVSREVRRLNSRITAAYNEGVAGARVVKALCREEKSLQEFSQLTGQMREAGLRSAVISALFLPAVQVVAAVTVGAVVWFGGLQARWGWISVGSIQAFIGYVTGMLYPVENLSRVYTTLQQSVASAERTFSLLDTAPEIVDRPGAIDPGTIAGDIEFDNVDFSYADGPAVLSGFTFLARKGETIALVGPTGGGKTTIVSLLCRFYEPRGGEIRIAGRDYLDLTQHALQSHIGVVLQTPHLFSGTVRKNILYGRLDASDDDVEQAARLAGAHDFIRALDGGYEAEVGEGGVRLSVGQKQLISIARAILARPEIFIMDEATSSVDTLTESMIQRGMESLTRNRTSFIIAHRLSTIRRADRIVFIDAGRIAESGTHAQLLRLHGRYYDLYTRQFRQERTAGADAMRILEEEAL